MSDMQAVVIFDGACNLCDGAVSVITRHDQHNEFELVALQSLQGQSLLRQYQLTDIALDSVILIKSGRYYLRSDAVIEIAKSLSSPASGLRYLAYLPKALRNSGYNLVAKYRYRLFGQKALCRLPEHKVQHQTGTDARSSENSNSSSNSKSKPKSHG
ncbi:DCC1-like thiol-disulfide oxidoreductase family protein [Shewanella marinintestina]|uniref:thiol-disulfide oxidoreductase DCC family protein n=1 Tax=Shewanella marinintestina TaxID=190305 RepID=UPI00200E79EB|nr:DCC1-like thiol-disulfide oxidoreductase family protein [Shewanella marinintestina]MCL1146920.1 DCC1-like thiol-disulfide oxidoreductase family protein [Shewanella marinintestina]